MKTKENCILILCIFVSVQTSFSAVLDADEEHIVEKRQAYGITNYEINESLKRLEKNVRGLENKLSRHEFREAQVADFSTKTLNALNSDHTLTQKNMQTVARQLVKMEAKILALDELIKTTNERQRHQFNKLSETIMKATLQLGIPKPPELPPHPDGEVAVDVDFDEVEEKLQKILKKAIAIDATIKNNLRRVDNDIKALGQSMNNKQGEISKQLKKLQNTKTSCKTERFEEIASMLARTGDVLEKEVGEAKKLLGESRSGGSCTKYGEEIEEKLDQLQKVAEEQEKEIATKSEDTMKALENQKQELDALMSETKQGREHLDHSFSGVMKNLDQLRENTKTQLENLQGGIQTVIDHSVNALNDAINQVSETLKIDTSNIINALDDTASQSENIQSTIGEHFDDLSVEIRGLKKVEQVMLNTADAVLDTKRSIEFGIQQVILELSDIVRMSGSTINSTLSNQINAISFDILKNQTSALTNMTRKMEDEISQVWRQIGIMYQEISTSVDLLDSIQSSTNQHMNASLNKVGQVDGTVGKINEKVAGVEDNLNYLLGRLSLVVSEFSQMKSGVGYELEKLRKMAKEFSEDTGPEEGKVVEYSVLKE